MKDIARLRKRDLKAWIPVDKDVRILARHISQAEWEEIRSSCTETILDPLTGKSESKEDEAKFRSALGQRVVYAIEGLEDSDDLDENGNPRPFVATPENITLLMEEWTEFRMTVRSTPLSFDLMLSLSKAQTEKN
jgi:hypothetical protein